MKHRPLIQAMTRRFPSPARDDSGRVWPEEVTVLLRLALGQKLAQSRDYLPENRGRHTIAVSWYWVVEPKHRPDRWYPHQPDGPVMRLFGRQILRPVTCHGGATHLEMTARAKRLLARFLPSCLPNYPAQP